MVIVSGAVRDSVTDGYHVDRFWPSYDETLWTDLAMNPPFNRLKFISSVNMIMVGLFQ